MTNPSQHLRFSLRLLARNPLFALVAIGTLGAGIGANTAIFSAVDAVLLHPLHFKDPNQLVLVTKNMPMFELAKSDASPLDFLDYRRLSLAQAHFGSLTPAERSKRLAAFRRVVAHTGRTRAKVQTLPHPPVLHL